MILTLAGWASHILRPARAALNKKPSVPFRCGFGPPAQVTSQVKTAVEACL
jgi:hypothetical protein